MKIGEVVYMTDWYYLPDKTILNLILIILRSTVVVQITAGKLFNMSIYTFGDVSLIVVFINNFYCNLHEIFYHFRC